MPPTPATTNLHLIEQQALHAYREWPLVLLRRLRHLQQQEALKPPPSPPLPSTPPKG